jgi:hypothetical protein
MLDRSLYDKLDEDAKKIAFHISEKLTDIVTDMLVLRAETDMNREELSELFNFSEPTVAELETY